MALKTKLTKVKFNGEKSSKTINTISNDESAIQSKHIIFDDDDDNNGEIVVKKQQEVAGNHQNIPEKKHSKSRKSEKSRKDAMDIGTLWYQTVCLNNSQSMP